MHGTIEPPGRIKSTHLPALHAGPELDARSLLSPSGTGSENKTWPESIGLDVYPSVITTDPTSRSRFRPCTARHEINPLVPYLSRSTGKQASVAAY
jgi:hypothetical protein